MYIGQQRKPAKITTSSSMTQRGEKGNQMTSTIHSPRKKNFTVE